MSIKFSDRYPPKNRSTNTLGVIDIELEDSTGKLTIDPNGAALLGFNRAMPLKGDPIAKSVLSGEPGYIYRTSEVELVLTGREMLRLMRRELMPDEVKKLLKAYGAFFEIHGDFYCEASGEALQPMSQR